MAKKIQIADIFKEPLASDYLEAVNQVTAWVDQYSIPTEYGKIWRRTPQAENEEFANVPFFTDKCLYCGSSSLGIYYLKLYDGLGDEKYLREAEAAASHILETYPGKAFYDNTRNSELGGVLRVPGWATGLFNGPTGEAYFINKLYDKLPKKEYLDFIRAVADDLLEAAIEEPEGIRWSNEFDLIGDGGLILFLVIVYKRFHDERYLEAIIKATDYIASKKLTWEQGGIFWRPLDLQLIGFDKDVFFANWSHGTAGLGWLFAIVYELTEKKEYLDIALDVVKFLESIAVGDEDGMLIPYQVHPVTGPTYDKFYLSTCHGPAGTTLFFKKLYEITEEEKYLTWITSLSRGIIRAGAPEKNSWGYWSNFCQCCGAAGVLEHFNMVYELTGKTEFLNYAKRTANVLLGDSFVEDGKRRWVGHWTRTMPEEVRSYTGLYVGSSGDAAALLHLYSILTDGNKLTPIFEYSF